MLRTCACIRLIPQTGSVRIASGTTLSMLRTVIATELDADAVPKAFAFEVGGAPASSKQEEEWQARELLPAAVLVPRHGDIFQGFEVCDVRSHASSQ